MYVPLLQVNGTQTYKRLYETSLCEACVKFEILIYILSNWTIERNNKGMHWNLFVKLHEIETILM